MIKVILFDVDGVLVNGEMFSLELERKYGITYESTQPFFKGVFQECLIGAKDLKREIEPYLKQWGWPKSVQTFLDEWFAHEHNTNEELIAYIQALRVRGIRCMVATNQEKYRADYILHNMGFKDKFDQVYASAHLGSRKPEQHFFQKLVNDLGSIAKEELLFWDDSPGHIAAAKAFGIRAELYSTFEAFQEKMKQYV